LFFQGTSFYSLLLGCLLVSSISTAEELRRIHTADASKQGVGQNIGFVEKLLNESAAAQQILQSDNQQARALQQEANTRLDAARAAQAQGNDKTAAAALNDAKKAIFTAMRLVGGKVVKDKKQENYNKKRQGLEALLAAHQRIRTENAQQPSAAAQPGGAKAAALTEAHTREKMQEAQALYDAGKLDEAGTVLNDAYLGLKVSLTKMRDGQTLVRELHFETAADEYRYELRRNDTHNILINTVLKEKLADPKLGMLMNIPLKKAGQLRTQAEQQAADGDFSAAIKTLEDSTLNIIRAIRMGGIFIPG